MLAVRKRNDISENERYNQRKGSNKGDYTL